MKATFVLPLRLLGVAAQDPVAPAQPPGAFASTGEMTFPQRSPLRCAAPRRKVLMARQHYRRLILARPGNAVAITVR
jgi:hypothetical protein